MPPQASAVSAGLGGHGRVLLFERFPAAAGEPPPV